MTEFSTSSEEYSSTYSSESYEAAPYIPKVYPENYDMHHFTDTKSRAVPEVVYPASGHLSPEEFFLSENKLNLENIKEHLFREGRLSFEQVSYLLDGASEAFGKEDNVLMLEAPMTICGDIHGQFYDLLKLFEVSGDPSTTNYLFLGDYVDRGNFSCEVIFLLYAYKIAYPTTFFMIRGNHECRHLTEFFTFKEECLYKYNENVYEMFMDSFDTLPLSAILNKQFFCVHGGLSPSLPKLDDINKIDRFREPPSTGPMCDLLWSDPMENFSPDVKDDFIPNKHRGCSYAYSYRAVCDFVERNNLLCVIRAHEVQSTGYNMMTKNVKTGFPSLITLFSAPNYCESYKNKAAIMKYENNVINIKQFQESPQPYHLPGFMNVIKWSLPFVSLKIADILYQFYALVDDEEEAELERAREAQEKKNAMEKLSALRTKVKTIGKIMSVYRKIKDEREKTVKYSGMALNGVVPEKIMNVPEDQLDSLSFEEQLSLDEGEKRPEIDDAFETKFLSRSLSFSGKAPKPKLRRTSSIGDLLAEQDQETEMPEIIEELSEDEPPVKETGLRFVQSSIF